MNQKRKETAVVFKQEQLAEGIYDMWIETGLAKQAKAGQFISVYTQDKSALLPRPISICEVNGSKLRIVYRVAGGGTLEFSSYKEGDDIRVLGPIGNGFPLKDGVNAILIGGGIGIPPMLELAKRLNAEKEIVLG